MIFGAADGATGVAVPYTSGEYGYDHGDAGEGEDNGYLYDDQCVAFDDDYDEAFDGGVDVDGTAYAGVDVNSLHPANGNVYYYDCCDGNCEYCTCGEACGCPGRVKLNKPRSDSKSAKNSSVLIPGGKRLRLEDPNDYRSMASGTIATTNSGMTLGNVPTTTKIKREANDEMMMMMMMGNMPKPRSSSTSSTSSAGKTKSKNKTMVKKDMIENPMNGIPLPAGVELPAILGGEMPERDPRVTPPKPLSEKEREKRRLRGLKEESDSESEERRAVRLPRKTLLAISSEQMTSFISYLQMTYGITASQIDELRKQKRLIKNRENATNVRQRKTQLVESLQGINAGLVEENERLKKEFAQIQMQCALLQEENCRLRNQLASCAAAPSTYQPSRSGIPPVGNGAQYTNPAFFNSPGTSSTSSSSDLNLRYQQPPVIQHQPPLQAQLQQQQRQLQKQQPQQQTQQFF